MTSVVARLARWRVPLGFVAGVAAFWLAQPSPRSVFIGACVAVSGELLRIWAAGHLNRWREVARSGPYRFMRHPLYVGSSLMAMGFAVAAATASAALLVAVYMVATLSAAVRFEANELRQQFGADYAAYRQGRGQPATRGFSVRQVIANREYRSASGLAIGLALLWWKALP